MLLALIFIPLIFLPTAAGWWAYHDPVSFTEHFNQEQLIYFLVGSYILSALIYLAICIRAKFNKHGLAFAIPIFAAGVAITVYSFIKMGPKRTFFGRELGTVGELTFTGFPYTLGHAIYKGMIFVLLGLFMMFNPSHELTISTGVWVVLILFSILVECCTPKSSIVV